jgi:hypothetical protein
LIVVGVKRRLMERALGEGKEVEAITYSLKAKRVEAKKKSNRNNMADSADR